MSLLQRYLITCQANSAIRGSSNFKGACSISKWNKSRLLFTVIFQPKMVISRVKSLVHLKSSNWWCVVGCPKCSNQCWPQVFLVKYTHRMWENQKHLILFWYLHPAQALQSLSMNMFVLQVLKSRMCWKSMIKTIA